MVLDNNNDVLLQMFERSIWYHIPIGCSLEGIPAVDLSINQPIVQGHLWTTPLVANHMDGSFTFTASQTVSAEKKGACGAPACCSKKIQTIGDEEFLAA